MRIRSFHIDAFGTLRDVTAEGLPEAGAVFLGHNEAGFFPFHAGRLSPHP